MEYTDNELLNVIKSQIAAPPTAAPVITPRRQRLQLSTLPVEQPQIPKPVTEAPPLPMPRQRITLRVEPPTVQDVPVSLPAPSPSPSLSTFPLQNIVSEKITPRLSHPAIVTPDNVSTVILPQYDVKLAPTVIKATRVHTPAIKPFDSSQIILERLKAKNVITSKISAARSGGTTKDEFYSVAVLREIAEILGIKKSLHSKKSDLAAAITSQLVQIGYTQ